MPEWLGPPHARPVVYVTMGTVFNESVDVFRTILDGLAGEPYEVVVTVGENGDPASLGPQPSNVHVERYIPQSSLLPHCSLLVSHAGSGAMLGALNAGVPMLALPQGADQFFNADRIVEAGVGLRLMPWEMTPEAVRECARRLIGQRSFLEAAGAHQSAIASMPTPTAVVPVLEAIAQDHTRV